MSYFPRYYIHFTILALMFFKCVYIGLHYVSDKLLLLSSPFLVI